MSQHVGQINVIGGSLLGKRLIGSLLTLNDRVTERAAGKGPVTVGEEGAIAQHLFTLPSYSFNNLHNAY
jgi:hypothetical protein